MHLWNSVLEFVDEEFTEVSSSALPISFILVTWVLFLMSFLSRVDWFLPKNLRIIFLTVFVLVEESSLFIWFCQLISLVSLMVFLDFSLSNLTEFRLLVKGYFLILRRAAFCSLIAILHSLLNQGVLRLFSGVVFAIVSCATAINISVKCYIRTILFGSWTSLLLRKVFILLPISLFCFPAGSSVDVDLLLGYVLPNADRDSSRSYVSIFVWVLGECFLKAYYIRVISI